MTAGDDNSVETELRILKEMRQAGDSRQVFITVTREDAAALARGLVQLHEQIEPGERLSKFEPKLPAFSDIIEKAERRRRKQDDPGRALAAREKQRGWPASGKLHREITRPGRRQSPTAAAYGDGQSCWWAGFADRRSYPN